MLLAQFVGGQAAKAQTPREPAKPKLQANVPGPLHAEHELQKRQLKVVQVPFVIGDSVFLGVNVSIGTPPQVVVTLLDTALGDVFVPLRGQYGCGGPKPGRETNNGFDAGASSSFTNLTTPFSTSIFSYGHADPSLNPNSTGAYVEDTISLGITIPRQRFAVVNDTYGCLGNGHLGIGYDTNEGGSQQYPNILDYMVQQKVIHTPAYSIWANDANGGEILFGGVDTEKYDGALNALPMIQQADGYRQPILALTSVDVNGSVIDTNVAGEVTLNPGSTNGISFLPQQIFQPLLQRLGASIDNATQTMVVNCSLLNSTSLGFTFTSTRIAMPLSNFYFPSDEIGVTLKAGSCLVCKWPRPMFTPNFDG